VIVSVRNTYPTLLCFSDSPSMRLHHEYTVSLRIVGEDLNTAEISRTLSVLPTRVIEIGDRLKTALATKAAWVEPSFMTFVILLR
jgi:hypothetical protein